MVAANAFCCRRIVEDGPHQRLGAIGEGSCMICYVSTMGIRKLRSLILSPELGISRFLPSDGIWSALLRVLAESASNMNAKPSI
jgi:hypothetical protein